MMWPASKRARRAKLAKRRQKVAGWETLGLVPGASERGNLPMDEIRRLAITLAGQGIGAGRRGSTSNVPAKDRTPEATTRRERRSSRAR
jgi:hypothetical protein